MELSEDQALDLVAQLDVSVLGSGREQQEQKTRNVTATTRYITDFVQQQWDARLTVLLVLRFHRMLTYDVHHVDDHGDPVGYLMVEFASWLTDVPLAPCDPIIKAIVTRHHGRRGGLAGVHKRPEDQAKHWSHPTENV